MITRCPRCALPLRQHDIPDRHLLALIALILAVALVTFGAILYLMQP